MRHELSRQTVELRLAGVAPEPIREHAVQLDGVWFPVKQAFEIATGLPRSSFTSHEARRHLAALGLRLRGDAARQPPSIDRRNAAARRSSLASPVSDETWAREAHVQASLIASLLDLGWHVVSAADTDSRERGIDIVAERESVTVGIEVKGYPGRGYADPSRARETKATHPSTQAGHWFAQGILAAMKLRSRQPTWRSVIALPKFPRYERILDDTQSSLTAARIEVWWVHRNGRIEEV